MSRPAGIAFPTSRATWHLRHHMGVVIKGRSPIAVCVKPTVLGHMIGADTHDPNICSPNLKLPHLFMRLTPDSRAPAKVDPAARAGVVVVVVVLVFCCRCCCCIWAQFCPCLGPRLAHVAHILASGSPHLGRCWPYLGLCSPYLGLMSAHVTHILADVGPMLAQACPYLSRMLTHLALLSAHVAHILADVGPMLAQACLYLSLMLTHVAHILADVGPMLAPRPSRCPVFRSGPLPKTQNHEKPMVF